jgi:hypothetical protein
MSANDKLPSITGVAAVQYPDSDDYGFDLSEGVVPTTPYDLNAKEEETLETEDEVELTVETLPLESELTDIMLGGCSSSSSGSGGAAAAATTPTAAAAAAAAAAAVAATTTAAGGKDDRCGVVVKLL